MWQRSTRSPLGDTAPPLKDKLSPKSSAPEKKI